MERPPRYRTGDDELDAKVHELVELVGPSRNFDLIYELVVSALRLARDDADRLDLKIANAALKEMRYAFQVFHPYRAVRKCSIFGSARIQADDPNYELTRDFASAIAEEDWMVVTGAGPGIMTAGIEGAGVENAFGVNIRLPFEAATSQFIADDPKLINFRYFFTRKLTFVRESDGFALLPGGFGTQDESFELLTLLQTGKAEPAPIVLLQVPGETYWDSWLNFLRNELAGRGLIDVDDLCLMTVTSDVEAAVDEITGFYSNYQSMRFARGKLILRVKELPGPDDLRTLNEQFGDIVVQGEIAPAEPTPEEVKDNDALDLPRIAFRFDRWHWARLRLLIDALNGRPTRS